MIFAARPGRIRRIFACFAVAAALLCQAGPADAQRGQRAADALPARGGDDTPTAIGGGSGLVVGGIAVDTTGRTASEARLAGWREAQRLAWPALWARLSGQPPATAPRLGDGALDSMVSAIEVEQEQIGPTRYVARLAIVFDRARAATWLGRHARIATSPPFLLMPILQDAGTRMIHEEGNPWRDAWARLRAGESPIDYVRIQPSPGDVVLLNAWQAERRHLFLWRALIDRYQVADVLIAELLLDRSYHGGPVRGEVVARFGTTGRELGRASVARADGDVGALADEAVRAADRIYVAALRAGNLLPDPTLIIPDPAPLAQPEPVTQFVGGGVEGGQLRVRVATPDDAALQSIQRLVAGTPGVSGVRLQSLVLGGESVLEIVTRLSQAELAIALDQRGLRLDGQLLRRRQPGDAPLAPSEEPAVEVPLESGARAPDQRLAG